MSALTELTDLLDRLDEADFHYTLSSVREGAIVVGIDAPGEHWEVEFMNDGDIEIEIFKSDGKILDASAIEDLFEDEDEDKDEDD